MNNQDVKYRHEIKYVISSSQMELLKSRAASLMHLDSHVGNDGIYTIRSLYFDDINNRCFYENENGNDPREKFRIRVYNHSFERISLECKRKERGKTLKTSARLTKEQAQKLMDGIHFENKEQVHPLLRRIILQEEMLMLRPKIIVEYERIPFVYENGNVRITFDTNVSSSSACSAFWNTELAKRPIMPVGHHLMEVKYDEYLPDFIYRALNLNALQPTAYSKYYLCRKYAMLS